MYESLAVFQTSGAMARHAGQRQMVVAQNIANADTPGYVARSLPPFQDIWRDAPALGLAATRPGHLALGAAGPARTSAGIAEPAPNGNAVSIEMEMLASIEAQREHSRALAIWRHGLTVLRLAVGR